MNSARNLASIPPGNPCPIACKIGRLSPPGSRTIEANMEPALSTPFPPPSVCPTRQLSEKPRHGVRSWNPAQYPGQFVCNSRTAMGLQFRCSGIVSGTVVDPSNGPTVSHCLGVAAKAKGLSIGLDIVGAIPVFGNAASGAAGIVRAGIAVDHAITAPVVSIGSGVYGAYGSVTAGPNEATDSLVGAGSVACPVICTSEIVSVAQRER
jgi:hypothetical protein